MITATCQPNPLLIAVKRVEARALESPARAFEIFTAAIDFYEYRLSLADSDPETLESWPAGVTAYEVTEAIDTLYDLRDRAREVRA